MKIRGKRMTAICAAALLLSCAAFVGCSGGKKSAGDVRAAGETTVIETPSKAASEYSARENAYIVAGKMKSLSSYRAEVSGEVVAGWFGYKQTIADTHIKSGDESFTQAKSVSALVSVGKQAFFKDGKAAIREASDVKKDEWPDECSVLSLEEYRSTMGVEPTSLSNYILNDETILEAEFIRSSAEEYTCRYEIDPVAGTVRYAVKMKSYGGLKSLPEFESCVLELTFDGEWNPIRLEAKDKYKIELIGTMSCTSTITEVFYDVGKELEIPDAEFFRAQLA